MIVSSAQKNRDLNGRLLDSWDFGVSGSRNAARLLDPTAVVNPELVGLTVMETYGVAEVDVVLGGGDANGEVVVSQFNTFDGF